jgi:hypothetical protein
MLSRLSCCLPPLDSSRGMIPHIAEVLNRDCSAACAQWHVEKAAARRAGAARLGSRARNHAGDCD